MRKILSKLTIFLSLFACFFIFLQPVLAKIEINNSPTRIEINKEFELDVVLSNLTDPTHFLSIAIHKNSGDPYFGQTQNGDNWIEADDSNCKSFPQVSVTEGTWSGKLKGKINYNEKDFDNSLGNYILKVFKYTDSCSSKSDSNDSAVELFDSNPPPSVTPTNIPTSVPTNSPVPSATPKPQATATTYLSPTVAKISIANTLKISNTPKPAEDNLPGAVLGEVSEPSITKTEEKQINTSENKKSYLPIFALLFGGGILFITAAVAVSVKNIKKNQKASGKSDFLL